MTRIIKLLTDEEAAARAKLDAIKAELAEVQLDLELVHKELEDVHRELQAAKAEKEALAACNKARERRGRVTADEEWRQVVVKVIGERQQEREQDAPDMNGPVVGWFDEGELS